MVAKVIVSCFTAFRDEGSPTYRSRVSNERPHASKLVARLDTNKHSKALVTRAFHGAVVRFDAVRCGFTTPHRIYRRI